MILAVESKSLVFKLYKVSCLSKNINAFVKQQIKLLRIQRKICNSNNAAINKSIADFSCKIVIQIVFLKTVVTLRLIKR